MKLLLFALFIFASCNLSDERRNLSGDWEFVDEGRQDRAIDSYKHHIPCNVIEYGYDDNFIIAAQKPTSDCFLGPDSFTYKYGMDSTYYWIIEHDKKLFIGPLDLASFSKMRMELGIPMGLTLSPVY